MFTNFSLGESVKCHRLALAAARRASSAPRRGLGSVASYTPLAG